MENVVICACNCHKVYSGICLHCQFAGNCSKPTKEQISIDERVKHLESHMVSHHLKIKELTEWFGDLFERVKELEKRICKTEEYFNEKFENLLSQVIDLSKWESRNFHRIEVIEQLNLSKAIERIDKLELEVFQIMTKDLENLEVDDKLNELESRLNRKFNEFVRNSKQPFKCPVCEGFGISNNIDSIKYVCHACEGQGIVWG